MNAVVIAHYSNDLIWTKNIVSNIKLYVYSTTNTQYNYYSINKGHEANLYLKFIIDNYNNLPSKILFLHDHQTSWHQDFNSDVICNNVNWDFANYFCVNKRDTYQEITKTCPPHARPYTLLTNYWHNIFLDEFNLPDKLVMYGSSQFVVSKDLILRHSRDFYLNCLTWLNVTLDPLNIIGNHPAHLFEWTWHYIFTGNAIEPPYEYSQIFNNIK